MTELARVFDEGDLDGLPGGRASYEITVPARWAGRACVVEVPRRVVCAACEGGGCDACERRGAYRLEDEGGARSVELRLPQTLDGRTRIRIGQPFGEGSLVGVLLLDVVSGDEASASCRLVPEPEQALASGAAAVGRRPNPALLGFVALVALLVALLLVRSLG